VKEGGVSILLTMCISKQNSIMFRNMDWLHFQASKTCDSSVQIYNIVTSIKTEAQRLSSLHSNNLQETNTSRCYQPRLNLHVRGRNGMQQGVHFLDLQNLQQGKASLINRHNTTSIYLNKSSQGYKINVYNIMKQL
jgi:hypothetical protein